MCHGERQGRRNPVPFQQEDRGYQGLQEDGHSAVFPTPGLLIPYGGSGALSPAPRTRNKKDMDTWRARYDYPENAGR